MLHPDEYFKDKTRLSIKKGGQFALFEHFD